jgi:DNA-binding TFAR19-related protein (PDSD5 family)
VSHEVEQEVAGLAGQGQVAELVHDEQVGPMNRQLKPPARRDKV